MSQPDALSGSSRLNTPRTLLFAMAAAFMVANIYYSQPLLAVIGQQFGIAPSDTALLVTITQLGYGLGVLLLVPLGDIMDRRRLASLMMALCATALVLTALSESFGFFAAIQLLIGMSSSATMVLIPYVATHSDVSVRGRRVGMVITGLLLGILLARTVSGLVADLMGWRSIYWLAAGITLVVLVVIRRVMVVTTSAGHSGYLSLLSSMIRLLRESAELRKRSAYAMFGMGSFSALWTGLTLLLTGEPYHFPPSTVGLFGLIGAAGAMSAGVAGRLSDRGYASLLTGGLAVMLALSWLLMAGASVSLLLLVAGILVLDVAAMGLQVVHQSIIYKLNPAAQSRITSVFVTAGFIGMAAGSALSSLGFRHWGWHGVCVVGAALPGLLVLHWLYDTVSLKKRRHV